MKTKRTDREVLSGGIFEVDQSNRIEDLSKDSYVAMARGDIRLCAKISKRTKKMVFGKYKLQRRLKFFGPELLARAIILLLKKNNLSPARLVIDTEYPGYEEEIVEEVKLHDKEIGVEFRKIGKNSLAHLVAYGFGAKKKNKNTVATPIQEGAAADLHPEFTGIRTRTRPK